MADWDAHPRCGRDLDHHLYSPEKAALRVLEGVRLFVCGGLVYK